MAIGPLVFLAGLIAILSAFGSYLLKQVSVGENYEVVLLDTTRWLPEFLHLRLTWGDVALRKKRDKCRTFILANRHRGGRPRIGPLSAFTVNTDSRRPVKPRPERLEQRQAAAERRGE